MNHNCPTAHAVDNAASLFVWIRNRAADRVRKTLLVLSDPLSKSGYV